MSDPLSDFLSAMRKQGADTTRTPALLTGTVISVESSTACTVRLGSDATSDIPAVQSLTSYQPVAGDVVRLIGKLPDLFIMGKLGPEPVHTHEHTHEHTHDYLDPLFYARQRATPGSGGGKLSWNGSVLSGSKRYIWIPGGPRNGWHVNLEGVVGDVNSAWSVTVPPWSSVSVRLTAEQWASTDRISVQPAQLIVTDYGATEQPSTTDLLLGVHNGDDGLFYLQDGRVLDYRLDADWRTIDSIGYHYGWASYASSDWSWLARFRKFANGRVELRGLIQGDAATNDHAFTLPVGYRPANHLILSGRTNSGTDKEFRVHSDGAVWFMSRDIWNSIACTYHVED